MNDKLMGIIYIIVAILIIAVILAIPNFYYYMVWIIAIALLIAGIYLLLFKNRY
jgi:hypothetical protein